MPSFELLQFLLNCCARGNQWVINENKVIVRDRNYNAFAFEVHACISQKLESKSDNRIHRERNRISARGLQKFDGLLCDQKFVEGTRKSGSRQKH